MFSIINSLNIPSYLFLLLCLMFFEIYGIIQIKKSSRKKRMEKFWVFSGVFINHICHYFRCK